MTNKKQILTVEITDNGGRTFTLREVCERGNCHAEFVIKLVGYGILVPLEDVPEAREWQFDADALSRLQKAMRLQRDLKLNLPGLAVSLDLLDELQQMRREVARLNQRVHQLMGD